MSTNSAFRLIDVPCRTTFALSRMTLAMDELLRLMYRNIEPHRGADGVLPGPADKSAGQLFENDYFPNLHPRRPPHHDHIKAVPDEITGFVIAVPVVGE